MNTGKVKFFKDDKGFGFIVDDKSGSDVFVHISKLNNKLGLRKDESVQYELIQGKKGQEASNVSVIGG